MKEKKQGTCPKCKGKGSYRVPNPNNIFPYGKSRYPLVCELCNGTGVVIN